MRETVGLQEFPTDNNDFVWIGNLFQSKSVSAETAAAKITVFMEERKTRIQSSSYMLKSWTLSRCLVGSMVEGMSLVSGKKSCELETL